MEPGKTKYLIRKGDQRLEVVICDEHPAAHLKVIKEAGWQMFFVEGVEDYENCAICDDQEGPDVWED